MLLEQLGRIDLNLLIILQVLLEERNGSKAARRLHLSQSAVSKALGRLRDTFNDPLFIRSAYGLEPTGRALALQQQLQPILLSLDNLIQPPEFDPASSEREFVIASMDSAFTLFAPLYLSELKRQAPRIRLRYEEWTENSLTEMSQGQVDIAFAVRENCISSDYRLDTLPDSICQRVLAVDDLTCLVQQHHPRCESPTGIWSTTSAIPMCRLTARGETAGCWITSWRSRISTGVSRQPCPPSRRRCGWGCTPT